ncbi:MAG: nucleotidyltransferase family protein [Polyangiaceae bacterium]
MWSPLRVRAPALKASEELRWVLLRAFAPLGSAVPRGLDASKIVRLSRDLDLAARIATRHAETLVDELGAEAARELSFHRLQVIAVDRVLWALSDEISSTAQALGCPVLWMKHAALRRLGLIAEGERAARDVDLLVPQPLAIPLQRALRARGFQSAGASSLLHLPPLRRAPGEVVEIHTALWGIELPEVARDAAGASAASLIEGGFVERVADGSYAPIRPILAAHAIVHGLVQHRTSPEGYPILRVLSDLCALGPLDDDAAKQCQALASHPLAGALTPAALRLSDVLRRGADVFDLAANSPEFELLSHAVAAGIDPAYRRALRFERIFDVTTPHALQLAFRSAFSTAEDAPAVGAEQGLPSVTARAGRPVALALELARGALSYGALRLKQRAR